MSVEIILAVVGLAAIVALCVGAVAVLYDDWRNSEHESVGPYRQGLDAAACISAMAFEAERLMFEAAQDAKREGEKKE